MPSDVQNRVTASDVARLAGVSRATVSHILNGYTGKFSAETEERVRAAASVLRYQPSLGGRVLTKGRSDIVIVLLPSAAVGVRLQEVLDAITVAAQSLGLNVLAWFSADTHAPSLNALTYALPAAVIDLSALDAGEREILEAAGIPVVPSSTRLAGQRSPLPDELVASAQLDLLADRRLVFAHLDDSRGSGRLSRAREDALRLACRARGVTEPLAITLDLTMDNAVAGIRALTGPDPLGIACFNDDVATSVLAASRRLGLDVPREIAIVGIDFTPLGQLLDPPLTTISIDPGTGLDLLLADLKACVDQAPVEGQDASYSITIHRGGTA